MKKMVVHCKSPEAKDSVYVGRPTKFGNPFTHLKHLGDKLVVVETREEAISKYEEWIRKQPELMAAAKRELKNRVLSCWCSPLSCHAEVLVKIANEE